VQVSVWDSNTASWGAWQSEGVSSTSESGGWSQKDVDLTAYASMEIRLGFLHSSDSTLNFAGWYIDDITLAVVTPRFTGSFESGWGDWGASRGVWQVGTPTAGPGSCFSGSRCAGTILDGNYPGNTDSMLISGSFVLPAVAGSNEIHLQFQQWFDYKPGSDSGQVQVSVWDSNTASWGAWQSEGVSSISQSGGWLLKDVDLTDYATQRIRLGFLHTANGLGNAVSNFSGWYIDEVVVSVF